MSAHRHRKRSPHPHCAWTSGGWTCRYRVTEALVGGVRVRCRFCEGHQCAKNQGGMPCGVASMTNFRYCQNHGRCTATAGAARCLNYVKALDANKYKYCAQLHNCSSEGCDQERATHPETEADLRYCPLHRCPQPACRREKIPQGPYCAAHTCAGDNCTAYASREGGGETGSPAPRYCDRHRVCSAGGCPRLCHIRENGVVAPHCGLHYCRADGCERERGAGEEACPAHSCVEAGCGRRRNGEVGGVFCKGHECKWPGCAFGRRRGEWCAEHVCARRRCEGGAGGDGYCERHQLCVVSGCEEERAIVGDRVLDKCEDHEAPACTSAGCTRRAGADGLSCPLHLCTAHGCRSPATPPLTLCAPHKCAIPHCAAPRWLHHPAASGSGSSPFCAQHACHHPSSCGERAEAGTRRCRAHARCRAEGCGRFAERGSEGYCGEHRGRGWLGGYSDQWADWGVAI